MADPQVNLPAGYQDAAPVVASGLKLPAGFEDAQPAQATNTKPPLGRDIFGDIPDNLYTRIGARIKENLNLPKAAQSAANAIHEGLVNIRDHGPSKLPEFLDAIKQYKDHPENLAADIISGYITAGAPEILPRTAPPAPAPTVAPEAAPLDLTAENKPYAGEKTPPVTPYPKGAEPPAPRIPDKYKPPIPGVNVPPSVGRVQGLEAIPGVDTPPSVSRINEPYPARPIPNEPPAAANPDYVPMRPSVERIGVPPNAANAQAASRLTDLAAERQANGLSGNSFGYQRAADVIRNLEKPISEISSEDLADMKGIGPKTISVLEQVKAELSGKEAAIKAANEDLTPALLEHLRQLRMREANPVAQAPKETLTEFNARLAKIADARKAAQ